MTIVKADFLVLTRQNKYMLYFQYFPSVKNWREVPFFSEREQMSA